MNKKFHTKGVNSPIRASRKKRHAPWAIGAFALARDRRAGRQRSRCERKVEGWRARERKSKLLHDGVGLIDRTDGKIILDINQDLEDNGSQKFNGFQHLRV